MFRLILSFESYWCWKFKCNLFGNKQLSNISSLYSLAAICLLIGILIYPSGWKHHSAYQSLCGEDISYTNTAGCELRWVFYLAIIAIFDAFILAILAFILANKQDKLAMDMHYSDYINSKHCLLSLSLYLTHMHCDTHTHSCSVSMWGPIYFLPPKWGRVCRVFNTRKLVFNPLTGDQIMHNTHNTWF